MENTAALQDELRRLEEQLARKKLEEEIRKLESQLEAARGGAGEDEDQEEELTEEEYDEVIEEEVTDSEYEDDEYEEEVVEEEGVTASPESAKKGRVPRWGGRAKQPPKDENAPRLPPVKPRLNQKLKKSNPFTKTIRDKEAAAAAKEEKKAARAAALAPKPILASGGAGGDDDPDLPDLPPLTPRVVPKVPASPTGDETPMEALLGPKLYKQGKLIATTTVAGCQGMDLVLLYFGAGWKRECKIFSNLLLDFYTITTSSNVANNDVSLEVIYVPQDRSLNDFKQVFAKMPYLSMATGTSAFKNAMSKALYITDVPALIVLDPNTGFVVTTSGVADIQALMPRRNIEACQALARKWKNSDAVPMAEAEKELALRNGNLENGILYWHE